MHANSVNYFKQRLPDMISKRLRCSQCCEELTFDPVHILQNNSVLCARCTTLNTCHAIRSSAFEDVAKYFLFSCKNDKCNMLLEREDVQQHEIDCVYGRTGCCSWWTRCLSSKYHQSKLEMYYVHADDKTHELITCSHCYGYVSAKPIYIQANGKLICFRCGPDLQLPPIVRDKPLETLLECFIIQCSYRMNGCTDRFKFGDECKVHEEICAMNPQNRAAITPQVSHGGKMKGVISTISSGHIYATITHNHFYQKYGKHIDEAMIRELQMQLPGMHSSGSHRSESESNSECEGRSLSDENYLGESLNSHQGDDDHRMQESMHMRQRDRKCDTLSNHPESVLYNGVVNEIKFKHMEKYEPTTDNNC